jgi:serine/threonine protein kinase
MDDDLDFGQTIRGFAEGQRVFARYVLKRILGRGGMGVVWLGEDEKLGELVALKFLPEMVKLDAAAIEELKRETRKSRKLTHPNIMRVHGFEEDAAAAAIVMEYVDGQTLSALRLESSRKVFLPNELEGILEELGEALTFAHEVEQVIHRDLKPANLMLNSRRQLKVADFGIASTLTDSASRMSVQRGSSGSPPYMSPQQMLGEPPRVTDDIYSVGATIYELLTSKPPFFRGNIYAQTREIVPPPMNERRRELLGEIADAMPAIPAEWEAAVARCLAKDPENRISSIAELSLRLDLLPPNISHRFRGQRGSPPSAREMPSGAETTSATREETKGQSAGDSGEDSKPSKRETQDRQDRNERPESKQRMAAAALVAVVVGAIIFVGLKFHSEKQRKENSGTDATRLSTTETGPTDSNPFFVNTPEEASKEKPFVNALGMKFVPVPGTNVLFSVWETRVKDYEAFCQATGRAWKKPGFALPPGENPGAPALPPPGMEGPHFEPTPQDPATNVTWEDAKAFCEWLSKIEGRKYRLPTDHEWSCAVGIGGQENPAESPSAKDKKIGDAFPWGNQWPPPQGAGNYRGTESETADGKALLDQAGYPIENIQTVGGFQDAHVFVAPVGSYAPNQLGIYDLGGNVEEWCADNYGGTLYGNSDWPVVRGASWLSSGRGHLLSSFRFSAMPDFATDHYGFRAVVESGDPPDR